VRTPRQLAESNIHGAGGGKEFGFLDDAALFGGELVGSPFVGVGFGGLKVIEEMVAAFGGTEEEGAALAVGEGGAEALGPGVGLEVGGFVEDDEVETLTHEVAGIEAAFDGDGRAVDEIDAEFGFDGLFGPEVAGDGFEAGPDDAFGVGFGGGDVPDETVGGVLSGAEEFGEGEFGFAEAAAGDEDPVAFGGMEDLVLEGVEI